MRFCVVGGIPKVARRSFGYVNVMTSLLMLSVTCCPRLIGSYFYKPRLLLNMHDIFAYCLMHRWNDLIGWYKYPGMQPLNLARPPTCGCRFRGFAAHGALRAHCNCIPAQVGGLASETGISAALYRKRNFQFIFCISL